MSVWDSLSIIDGETTFIATIEDMAGNTASDRVTLLKDISAPRLAITEPADGWINADSLAVATLSGTCDNWEADDTVTFSHGSLVGDAVCGDDSTFSVTLDFSSVTDHNFELVIDIVDSFQNSGATSKIFQIDAVKPTLTLATPADPRSFLYPNQNLESFAVSGTCDDAEAVISFNDLKEIPCDGTHFATTLDLSTLEDSAFDANHQLTVVATIRDEAGNETAVDFIVVKDLEQPTLTLIAADPGVNGDNVTDFSVSGVCSEVGRDVDLGDLGKISCRNENGSGEFEIDLDLSALPEGEIELVATHTDEAGNSAETSLTIDKNAIAPAIAFATPATGAFINAANESALAFTGTCNEAGEDNIRFSHNGSELGSASCDGSGFATALDLAPIDDADPVAIQAEITDAHGGTGSATLDLVKDTQNPVVEITMPAADDVLANNNLNVTGTCQAADGDVTVHSANETCQDAGTFSATVDLSALAEGYFELAVSQTDAAGNKTEIKRRVIKNVTPPAIAFATPAAASFINAANESALAFTGTCNEAGEDNIRFSHNDAELGSASCDGFGFSTALDLAPLDDADPVAIRAEITDAWEGTGSGSATLDLIKDSAAPALALAGYPEGSVVANSLTLAGSCEDGLPVVFFDGTELACSGGAYSQTFNIEASPEGAFVLTVAQTDAAGNATTIVRNLTKNAIAPVVAFTTPAAASFINAANQTGFVLAGTCDAAGEDNIRFSHNDAELGSASCDGFGFSTALDLAPLDDADPVAIRAEITDAWEGTGSATLDLIKDSAAPALALAGYPEGSVVANSLTLAGSCEDGLPVVFFDGTELACSGGAYSQTFNIKASPEGAFVLTVAQTDAAGNATTIVRNLKKDAVTPELAITRPEPTVPFPVNAANVTSVDVEGSCNVPDASVTFDHGFGTIACDGTEFRGQLNLSTLADTNEIVLTATLGDASGESASAIFLIAKDVLVPRVAFGLPPVNSYIREGQDTLKVAGNCDDEGARIAFSSGDINLKDAACDGTSFEAELDVTMLPEGEVVLTASVADDFQNSSQIDLTLTKDSTPPTLSVDEPTDAFSVSAADPVVTVSGTCLPDGSIVIIRRQGKTICSNGTFSKEVNLARHPEGASRLNIILVEASGNTARTDISFTVDTLPPTLAITSPVHGDPIGIANNDALRVWGICSEKDAGISFKINGTVADEEATCQSSLTFSTELDISDIPDGNFLLETTIADNANNTSSVEMTLIKTLNRRP